MNIYGKRAGQSTRDMAEKRHRSRVWFVLLTTGAVLLILILISNLKIVGFGGLLVLGLLFLVRIAMDYMEVRAKQMRGEERRAIRGAEAEERIGADLDDLGEDYLVIHDVISPYGNIDHVVIGKQNGVFLIETKAHGGRVSAVDGRLLVNGHEPEKDFIAQALKSTYWLRDEIHNSAGIDTWITPVVVFTNAFVERTAPIKGVRITNIKYIQNVLQSSSLNARNLSIWESREKILEALCS
jgi:hypothetical protein